MCCGIVHVYLSVYIYKVQYNTNVISQNKINVGVGLKVR